MHDLKISLITVSFNAESTISRCIESVIAQNYKNVEYIIVDGKSTDKTAAIISRYKHHIDIFLSENDQGIYDAMNKGIRLASGDIIGMLNADDFFADNDVLGAVNESFLKHSADIIYGDLDFVDKKEHVTRKWRSKLYKQGMFNRGWMPAHPTFYCKKNLFQDFGFYSLKYGTVADYELMLRFMHLNKINAFYLKKVMVKMKIGGVSNKSISNRVKGLIFDLKAMQSNGIFFPPVTLVLKPLRKIGQYIVKNWMLIC